MKDKYKKCPYCSEKILIEAKKCRYCEEWLIEKKEDKSNFKKIFTLIKRAILWSGIFFFWLIYAISTLDKSEEAYKHTLESGPVPSGYSILILGLILSLLLRKQVFNKSKKFLDILAKIFVFLIIGFGIWSQLDYDPTLSKLKNYYDQNPKNNFIPASSSFTGDDLMNEVNKYRSSKGLQTIKIDSDLCTNIFKPYEQAVELVYGRRTMGDGIFAPWFKSDLQGVKDNYNDMTGMVLSSSKPISDAIYIWINSPADRINLEHESFNSGCSYARDGVGVLVMGEKK